MHLGVLGAELIGKLKVTTESVLVLNGAIVFSTLFWKSFFVVEESMLSCFMPDCDYGSSLRQPRRRSGKLCLEELYGASRSPGISDYTLL